MASWEQARRRYELVHAAAADFASGGGDALAAWRPVIEKEYGNNGNFLRDIQRRYLTAAEARLDAVLEAGAPDPEGPLAAALAQVAEANPDLRRLLENYAGHPALAKRSARFRRIVIDATGVDPVGYLPGGSPRGDSGHCQDSAAA